VADRAQARSEAASDASPVGGERVAVADIGTNSTRLLIAELAGGRVARTLARHTTVTRLGAGVDREGRLSAEAIDRVFATLARYRADIDRHSVDRALAVMTSAVRDAANGGEFAAAVRERFGLEPHVLSGEQEARLTYLGALSGRPTDEQRRTLVVDIGGGSTELVLGRGREVGFHVSVQAGVVRQSERHIRSDPPAAAELEELAGEVRALLANAVPERERSGVELAIAVAGTATSLAAIAQRLEPYDPDRVEGYTLTAPERERILASLARMTRAEREQVPGLHPARAPTIVPGVVILGEVMRLFGLEAVEVSEHDILHGAALAL
jgi:exopolyphosphatase/guanosine-5'-triphosphate,3'-diphosphate pyrophosphatase